MLERIKSEYEELRTKVAELVQDAEASGVLHDGAARRAWVISKVDGAIRLNKVLDDVLDIDGLFIGFLVDKIVDAWNIVADGKITQGTSTWKVAAVADAPLEALRAAAASGKTVDERLDDLYSQYGIKRDEPTKAAETAPSAGNAEPKPAPTPTPAKTDDLQRALSLVFASEGGFSDHPADSGGPTNYGISAGTLATAVALGLVKTVNVRNITKDEAATIYRKLYWEKAGCDKVQWYANYLLFDAAVNGGIGMAAKVFQLALNATFMAGLAEDGKWGPKTQGAILCQFGIERSANTKLAQFGTAYLAARKAYYDRIIARNPSQDVFREGWYNRLRALAKAVSIPLPKGL